MAWHWLAVRGMWCSFGASHFSKCETEQKQRISNQLTKMCTLHPFESECVSRRKGELLMTSDFNKAATASNLMFGKRGSLGPGESSLGLSSFLTSLKIYFVRGGNFLSLKGYLK